MTRQTRIALRVEVEGNATQGEFFFFDYLLHNYSSATATETWTVDCYLSSDDIITATDDPIGGVPSGGPVLPKFTVEDAAPRDAATTLEPNYPNPFNPTTTIAYTLQSAGPVTIEILDVRGRHVRTLVDGSVEGAGRHEVIWDGTSDEGQRVSSGVYFYNLATPEFRETRRMVLIK